MASKFMKVRKVAIPMLTLVAILAQTGSAFALSPSEMTDLMNESPTVTMELAQIDAVTMASPSIRDGYTFTEVVLDKSILAANTGKIVSLNDIKGHWGEKYIQSLVNAGGISGYPDGSFKPDQSISTAELLSIIIGATKNDTKVEGNWAQGIMQRAYDLKVITPQDIPKSEAETAITREKMALVLVNSATALRNEDTSKAIKIDDTVISDLNKAGSAYKQSIKTAYGMGLLAGQGNGAYNPKGNTSRAEASVIVCRLTGLEARAKVEVGAPPEVVPPVEQPADKEGMYKILPDRSNTSPTVGYQDIGLPYEGAINPHTGKAITRDPASGVLGFGNGQKGGIYLGLKYADGFAIKVNSDPGFVYDLANGLYQEKGGYTFFEDEWTEIIGVANNKLKSDGYRNSAGVFATDKAKEGMMADIHGNISTNASEAFFQVIDGMWVDRTPR